jgi:hypothetical protein
MGLFDNPVTGALTGGLLGGAGGASVGGLLGLGNPFSSPAAPGAPDYVGAAEATAAGNLAGAQAATEANRPGQYNPFGSSVWQQGPGGEWSQQVSFSPEQQALYEQTQAGKQAFLGQGAPEFGANRERVMEAMMGRGMGDIGRSREQKHSQLIAQGIPPGSEAYETEMDRFGRQEVDLRQQAEIGATQQAGQEYGAELAGRGQQLGAISAFSPQSPQFNQFYQQQAVPGADYMGAAQQQGQFDMNQYNAQQAQQNAMMQGLFGLGAAGIFASDRRLKHNIKRIGELENGLPVYEFSYNGNEDRYIGCMSGEVKEVIPGEVLKINGYDAVNYRMF